MRKTLLNVKGKQRGNVLNSGGLFLLNSKRKDIVERSSHVGRDVRTKLAARANAIKETLETHADKSIAELEYIVINHIQLLKL